MTEETQRKKQIRILLADDVPSYREGIATRLNVVCQSEGLEAVITQVSDGDEVIKQITENPDSYDLVFTDNKMERVYGYEATAAVRAAGSKIPIYLISGTKFSTSDLKKIKATGYIKKPLEFEAKGRMKEMIQRDLEEFDSELGEIFRKYSGGRQ